MGLLERSSVDIEMYFEGMGFGLWWKAINCWNEGNGLLGWLQIQCKGIIRKVIDWWMTRVNCVVKVKEKWS
jgi:hypothetical protein